MVNGILGGLRTKSRPKVWEKISRFSRLKWTMAVENSAGNPNSFLVPLEKQPPEEIQRLDVNAWWSKRFTYHNCLFSALLNISSQSEAAVRERPTFFGGKRQTFFGSQQGRQTFSAVRQRHRTLRKRLVESWWSDQNQEMEIESLWIRIILSTKPRKQTTKSMSVTKNRSCLPYIVWIDQTDSAFLSLWLPIERVNLVWLYFCTLCICVISFVAR